MSSFRIRPRFTQTVDLDLEQTRARIVDGLTAHDKRFEVKCFPGYITLRIPEQDRHFWTPRLTLSLYEAAEGGTRIEGIYGPNANVWSIFLYGYLFIGSAGLFAGIFGFCQWMIGIQVWGLWLLALLISLAATLYFIAQLGQKLGAWQTFLLHQAYETVIGRPAEIH
jgi:hypothetical protein